MRMILALLAVSMTTHAVAAGVATPNWMVGTWSMVQDGVTTRETWLPPLGGAMAGATVTADTSKPASIEFASITTGKDGLIYTAVVNGQPPTAFVRKSGSSAELVFENLEHDFPQRVIYRQCGNDLCARIEGLMNGKLQAMDWRYRRVKR